MATQNLFEKFGIKEVADVTFFRIEKKEETFETIREFETSSVIKGAVELRTVYPIDEAGVGTDEGFEAYVFTDANILNGTNYDCDDVVNATVSVRGTYAASKTDTDFYDSASKTFKEQTNPIARPLSFFKNNSQVTLAAGYPVYVNNATKTLVSKSDIATLYDTSTESTSSVNVVFTLEKEEADMGIYSFKATYTDVTYTNTADTATGVYDKNSSDPDADRKVGTHEYSYAEQAFMLFAKRQNLIAKNGTRYQFANAEDLMGNLAFSDSYVSGPHSVEKVVVLGLANTTGWTDGTYDMEGVNEAIKNLKESFSAKAYVVSYGTYAELVVEDEMGYYNPNFLGYNYRKNDGTIDVFTSSNSYSDWAGALRGIDAPIATAQMWGEDVHYSINDAIDALKQKKLILDSGVNSGIAGINGVYGGYKVTSEKPTPTTEDTDPVGNTYSYYAGETQVGSTSKYNLTAVINALTDIGYTSDAIDKAIRVAFAGEKSNRAIYVQAEGSLDLAAGAYIYLLHNKRYRALASDVDGIFTFEDRMGNTLYYQDKIFKGTEWLALVIIGNQGLIYVVNRHGAKTDDRVAWMINENGYINDTKAAALVKNGLIHTTTFTADSESFEATAEVIGLSTKKVNKTVKRYTPVLFLDSLKVSTIEQTAEEVYATGGRGNGNLIGWDFGKAITLSLQDALFTPASMSATFGSYEGNDFRKGVKDVKSLDRMEKCTAKRNFIVPAGNSNGTPSEADKTAQAIYIDINTMEPYQDGTPIAEGEEFLKFTRSVAYKNGSLGHEIEISADKFPGTYKIVGDTYVRSKETGEDERFQFTILEAKMGSEQTITLEADGDPAVFDLNVTVLRPDNGVMMKFVQYNVIENEQENDGSTMVKGTENLNLLDDAELFKISTQDETNDAFIGATEY